MNEAEYLMKRIVESEEGVIRPRRVTPSEIFIILRLYYTKAEFNNCLLFIQNNSLFEKIAKTCLPPSMLSSFSIEHVKGCSAPQIFSK